MQLTLAVTKIERDEAFWYKPLPGGEEYSLRGVTVVELASAGIQGTHAPFGCLTGAIKLILEETGEWNEGDTYTITIKKGSGHG